MQSPLRMIHALLAELLPCCGCCVVSGKTPQVEVPTSLTVCQCGSKAAQVSNSPASLEMKSVRGVMQVLSQTWVTAGLAVV